jgi:intraflagellar transport protein 122
MSPSVLAQGDACATCHTAFLRSFITYDHLPAVLFELVPDITHDEALRLLSEAPSTSEVGVTKAASCG